LIIANLCMDAIQGTMMEDGGTFKIGCDFDGLELHTVVAV